MPLKIVSTDGDVRWWDLGMLLKILSTVVSKIGRDGWQWQDRNNLRIALLRCRLRWWGRLVVSRRLLLWLPLSCLNLKNLNRKTEWGASCSDQRSGVGGFRSHRCGGAFFSIYFPVFPRPDFAAVSLALSTIRRLLLPIKVLLFSSALFIAPHRRVRFYFWRFSCIEYCCLVLMEKVEALVLMQLMSRLEMWQISPHLKWDCASASRDWDFKMINRAGPLSTWVATVWTPPWTRSTQPGLILEEVDACVNASLSD